MPLTLSHTIPNFNDLEKEAFENIVGKGENVGNQHFSPFPTVFSTLPKTNFKFSDTFIVSSANAFNLNQCKILWFGKELNNIYHLHILSIWSGLTFRHPIKI